MDHPGGEIRSDPYADPELDAALETQGPLSDQVAARLLARGRERLDAGEHGSAIRDFQRIVGHQDANLTGAAMLGTADALYRLDREDDARSIWQEVTRLPENDATYRAWRNLAGVHVREGDLGKAVDAYRQADRRAPAEDKAEIAARLGWLAKETGNAGAASRYFARSRGATGLSLTLIVIAVTAAVSFVGFQSPDVQFALQLNRAAVLSGQVERLLTVALVHAGFLHLFLNLYALWVVGPIVESIWGRALFLAFYVLTAIAASTASIVMGTPLAVGASGAIFGLVGVILAGTRAHHPILDRRARGIVPQLGMFVIINLVFGFVTNSLGARIDNAAHIGGLLAGLWLGFLVPPGSVPSLRSAWQRPGGEPAKRSPILIVAGIVGLLGVVAAGLAFAKGLLF